MNYQEYNDLKKNLDLDKLVRYDCMNIYKSLEPLLDEKVYKHLENHYNVENVQINDFVENFTTKTNFLDYHKEDILVVNKGVVNTLDTIFSYLFDKEFVIPSDVYPVYLELAKKNNLKYTTYESFPDVRFKRGIKNSFEKLEEFENKVVLITYPLKPIEENLDYDTVKLLVDNGCIVIFDCVYMRDGSEYLVDDFAELPNVIFLHSMSKTFLRPKKIGIVLDNTQFSIPYELADEKLVTEANDLINLVNMNEILKRIIPLGWLAQPHNNIPFDFENTHNYFKVVKGDFNEFLDKGILTIPLSVFGVTYKGYVLITPLLYISDQLKKLQ